MADALGCLIVLGVLLGLSLATPQPSARVEAQANGDPFLTLVKEVVNLGGGTAVAGDFTLMAIGPVTISGPGNSAAVRNQPVPAGTYQLRESGPPNYVPSVWDCFGTFVSATTNSVTLAVGDNATCGIINTFRPPVTTSTTSTTLPEETTTLPEETTVVSPTTAGTTTTTTSPGATTTTSPEVTTTTTGGTTTTAVSRETTTVPVAPTSPVIPPPTTPGVPTTGLPVTGVSPSGSLPPVACTPTDCPGNA